MTMVRIGQNMANKKIVKIKNGYIRADSNR